MSISCVFIADGAVRPPSGRLMPLAAHNRLASRGNGNSLRENSRIERRRAIASINGMPPDLSGAGREIFGVALPRAGFGRNCPMAPSASLVRVLIGTSPQDRAA